MVVKHDCKPHEFQDRLYGLNNRVMNQMKDPEKVRCTVCSAIINPKSQTAVTITPKK